MKPAVLLLILLLSGIARAQDWGPLSAPGVKRYFTNKNQYLRGMRVDSVTVDGSAEVYHLFRSLRGKIPSYNLDSNGASWLGNKVRKEEYGRWLFPTWLSDTIVINPGAALGETWRMYDDSGTTAYDVTVTALDTATVLGALDSVKTLTIAALPASGLPADDSLHGWTIVLSKVHGFVQVPDVWMWPYHRPGLAFNAEDDMFLSLATDSLWPGKAVYDSIHLAVFRLIPYHDPTKAEVFDFDVDNAFAYYYEKFVGTGGWIDTIRQKFDYLDSTVYQMAHWYWDTKPTAGGPVTTGGFKEVTVVHKAQPLLSYAHLMPEEWRNETVVQFYEQDTSHCTTSSCWVTTSKLYSERSVRVDLVYPLVERFKAGYGQIERRSYDSDEGPDRFHLYGSFKNGLQCGFIGKGNAFGILSAQYKQEIVLFPNPARATLTVSTPKHTLARIILTDATGRTVLRATPHASRTETSIAHLPPGLYLLTAFDKTGARHTARVTIAP